MRIKPPGFRRPKRQALSRRIGFAPGEIHINGEGSPAVISYYRYNKESVEKGSLEVSQIQPGITQSGSNLWLDIIGVHDAGVLKEASWVFGIHPIAAEDIHHTVQRPKVEEYDKQLFMVLRMLRWDEEAQRIENEQVSLVCGDGYVLSFQERPGDVFEPVRQRIAEGRGRVRAMDADYLLYCLADAVVDNYFLVLEALQDRYERLEEEVLFNHGPDPSPEVHALSEELLRLRRAVWPLREAASSMMNGQIEQLSPEVRIFFRDIFDHIVQMIDLLELTRDSLKGLVAAYQSRLSTTTNEVMRVLTIVATIFIPLTFIAGIYGMNFSRMPELSWPFGYPLALGLMGAVGLGMILYFKRKKWL